MSSIAVDGGGMQTVKKPPRKKRKKNKPKKKLRASNISALFDQSSLNKTQLVFMNRYNQLNENPNHRPIFSGKTRNIYFPHGNITEGIAMKYIENKFLDKNRIRWQEQKEAAFNMYERAYNTIFDNNNVQTGFKAHEGVGSEEYTSAICPYIITSRPDGIYNRSHIIEIKSPWGNLTKRSGSSEQDENYDCKLSHRLQVFIECLCHKKQKGFYFMYYNPYGWEQFLTKLAKQYHDGVKEGDIVFKPDIHPDMNMFTVMQRIKEEGWYDYAKQTANVDPPQGPANTEGKQIYEEERPKIINLLNLTNIQSLMDFGFPKATAYKIYQKFKFGNDIHRGIVKSVDGDDITILWDAVKNEENIIYGPEQEVISLNFFRTGYLHILKVLNSSIRRKGPEWKAWEKDILGGNVPQEIPMRKGYEECVWLELDFSNREFRESLRIALDEFLESMFTGVDPWHRGEGNNSKRNLEELLKNIPVKQIAPRVRNNNNNMMMSTTTTGSSSGKLSITTLIKNLKF